MRIKSSGRRIMVSALAAALPVATAIQLMLAPASASAASASPTSMTALQLGQASAAPRAGLILKGRQSAQLTLASVGAGVRVRIQGGGGDTSNCTNDETTKTLTTGAGPVVEDLSFDTRGSGSCAYERSYSYFAIWITGRNAAGVGYDSYIRVFFGQLDNAASSYTIACAPSSDIRMSCRETSSRSADLAAFPSSLPNQHSRKLTTPRSVVMTLANVGTGPQVSIRGGGGGTSNCTSDETTTSFTAGPGLITQVLGFDSRGSGSCAYERSWSDFRVTVKGRASDGASFDSSANVRYGQQFFAGDPYTASCGDERYLIHMTCEVRYDQIELRAEPLR